jgi:hypothetical protein
VHSLESVVMRDTKGRERRQADGKEKYADQHSKGESGFLVRVTEVHAQEKSKGQVPEHSSCGTSRVKATIGVDFSPYSTHWERCRRLESAYGAIHGIDSVLIADEHGNAQIDSSASGGVGAGDAGKGGAQDDSKEVGKNDEGENQSVKGEEVPETSGGLSAQLWRKILGASKPLQLALVGDDRVLDLLAKLLRLLRDGRREERRFEEREQLLLLVQTEVGEVLGLEAKGTSNAFFFRGCANKAITSSRLGVGAWTGDVNLDGQSGGRRSRKAAGGHLEVILLGGRR